MSDWISVKDRLPDNELEELKEKYSNTFVAFKGVEVIVMIVGATLPTALLYDGEDFYMDGIIYQVTHWQPMPEPPKGD